MATNKVEFVKALVELTAKHTFDEKELARFCNETAAEVNNASNGTGGGFVELVKSATVTKTGISLKAENVKIKRDKYSLRVKMFVACLHTADLNGKMANVPGNVRCDLSELCDQLRTAWKVKDAPKPETQAAVADVPVEA
jgi:hypothetical protein